jgi:hypothetical protein
LSPVGCRPYAGPRRRARNAFSHANRGRDAELARRLFWSTLLLYVLLRFVTWVHRWTGSFSRLFTLLRATLWMPKNLAALLDR